MNRTDEQYLFILKELLYKGERREGRNGVTHGLFGRQMRFDLSAGFPLLTTKRVHFHSIVVELLWFLRGDTNIKFLKDHCVSIWDEWADEKGDLGPVYGSQWRSWHDPNGEWHDGNQPTIDQIDRLVEGLKRDPYGRRHIVTAWNPAEIEDMALPPCHCLFQFYVGKGKLSCHLYQRSADWFLGVPFNIASYALLTHIIANEVGLEVGEFVHSFGDLHLYDNHVEQAKLQIQRPPLRLPNLKLVDSGVSIVHNPTKWSPDNFVLEGYDPHPAIKAEVSK